MTISKKLVLFLIFLSVCSWSEWNKHYSGIDGYIFPGGRLIRELEDFTCMIIFFLISPLPSPPPHIDHVIFLAPPPPQSIGGQFSIGLPWFWRWLIPPSPPFLSIPPKASATPPPLSLRVMNNNWSLQDKNVNFYIYLLARIGLKYLEFRSFP